MANVLKGHLDKSRANGEERVVTISEETGDKVGLDVSIVGGAVSATVPGGATEAGQDDIVTELQAVNVDLAALETLITATNAELTKRLTFSEEARIDAASANITTGAYSQLIASTDSAIKEIEIYNSTTQTLQLAIGASSSEVDYMLIPPFGNGRIPLIVAESERIAIKAISANATTGEVVINLYKEQ